MNDAVTDTGGRQSRVAQWFLFAVLSGLAWRALRFGLHFEITCDEAGILRSVMERDYRQLLEPLSYANVSPPLFLWLTKALDSAFRSEWAVRLVPFLAGLAAVGIFWLVCRETLRGYARWLAWALFCVSNVPIAEGTRVKGYTVDLLVATVLLWLMLRWLLHGREVRYLIWLGLCGPPFVWLSYTSVLVIGAAGLVLLVSMVQRRGDEKRISDQPTRVGWQNVTAGFVFLLVTAASALVLYLVNVRPGIHASLANGLADFWKGGYPPLDHPLRIPVWLLVVHTGRGFAWPVGENHFGSSLTCALWLTGLVVYWRRGNRLVWTLLLMPQILSLAAACLHRYPYLQNPRLCMFLGPSICIFVAAGGQYLIDRLRPEKRRPYYRFAALALLLCALGGITRETVLRIREVNGPGIRSTLKEASQMVGKDGQFIVLNDENASDVFAYYIRRVVAQKVWQKGRAPAQELQGKRLALVAVTSETAHADTNSLFKEFEARLGSPLTVRWAKTAREALLDNKDSISIWVCDREK